MEWWLNAIWAIGLIALAQGVIALACAQHAALARWQGLLTIISLIYVAAIVFKQTYWASIFPPVDAATHEWHARGVADAIASGDWRTVWAYARPGNPAYQLLVGGGYAVTGAPQIAVIGLNSLFAFWGMLTVLEVFVRRQEVQSISAWLVCGFLLAPSAVYWSAEHLKEGPVLWGLCQIMRVLLMFQGQARRGDYALLLLGLTLVGLLRPHIGGLYLAGLAVGAALAYRQLALAAVMGAGFAAVVVLLAVSFPDLMEKVVGDGVIGTMDQMHARHLDRGYSSLQMGGRPIPVVTGAIIILFRPFPWEAGGAVQWVAGLEIWLLTGAILWLLAAQPRRWPRLMSPTVVVLGLLFLLMAFFFSYSYNIGLMVRQRVMCFPILYAFIAWLSLPEPSSIQTATTSRQTASAASPTSPSKGWAL